MMADEKVLAKKWADLNSQRQDLLDGIEQAQAEVERIEDQMADLFDEMGEYGRQRAYALADI